jgi:hypothetical protein
MGRRKMEPEAYPSDVSEAEWAIMTDFKSSG